MIGKSLEKRELQARVNNQYDHKKFNVPQGDALGSGLKIKLTKFRLFLNENSVIFERKFGYFQKTLSLSPVKDIKPVYHG